ncbi:MAG: hypothetical protein JRC53_04935, partial [Deltaproteobacteria bacterium]|nr:hypothetical protein [Deltaproteobacteria bacterium]
AETSELVLALAAIERYEEAQLRRSYIIDKKDDDGSYWMGVTFPDEVIWPEERTSWTTAAVLLAYDALNNLTPASCLFSHDFWEDMESIDYADDSHQEHYSYPVPPMDQIGG